MDNNLETIKRFLQTRDWLEMQLGELKTISKYVAKKEVSEKKFISNLQAYLDEVSQSMRELCVLLNEINLKPIDKRTPDYLESRFKLIGQVLNACLQRIQSLRDTKIRLTANFYDPNDFRELKQLLINFYGDLLKQFILFLGNFDDVLNQDINSNQKNIFTFTPKINMSIYEQFDRVTDRLKFQADQQHKNKSMREGPFLYKIVDDQTYENVVRIRTKWKGKNCLLWVNKSDIDEFVSYPENFRLVPKLFDTDKKPNETRGRIKLSGRGTVLRWNSCAVKKVGFFRFFFG